MKKGFTLIELLAVIIILAILMIVAVPNVLGTLNDAKKSTFITQAQSLYTSAEQQWVLQQMKGNTITSFTTTSGGTALDLSTIASNVKYEITMSATGAVTGITVDDGAFRIVLTDGTKVDVNNIKEANLAAKACGALTCPAS